MDLKLEVVILPVSDVDRAEQFYKRLGWREDAEIIGGENFRIVQLTPRVGMLDQLRHRRDADDPRVAAGTAARRGRHRGGPRRPRRARRPGE